jgi:hypothetical protein
LLIVLVAVVTGIEAPHADAGIVLPAQARLIPNSIHDRTDCIVHFTMILSLKKTVTNRNGMG